MRQVSDKEDSKMKCQNIGGRGDTLLYGLYGYARPKVYGFNGYNWGTGIDFGHFFVIHRVMVFAL